jgi:carbon storage regulator
MLVLSRQRDESIIIGDNIVVTIVDIRGDKVRLGIKAPPEISVHREEIYELIQKESQQKETTNPETADGESPPPPSGKSRSGRAARSSLRS